MCISDRCFTQLSKTSQGGQSLHVFCEKNPRTKRFASTEDSNSTRLTSPSINIFNGKGEFCTYSMTEEKKI